MRDALHKNTAKVGLAILLSRILGLVREQVFAAFFGASTAMDAYNVAFRVPNLLRDLFAEGAMSSAFVSVFSRVRAKDGDARAHAVGRKVLTLLGVVVGLVVLAGVASSGLISSLFAPDFARIPGKLEMTSRLMALMFPFLWMVSLSAVFMGMLNAGGRFGLPALAPSLFNVGNLVFGGLAALTCHNMGIHPIYGMALGTLAGGLLQWGLLIPSCRKTGFFYRPENPAGDRDVGAMTALMIPSLIGLSAVQINIFITTNFASSLGEGSISWLGYAFRFMQLPIGIFGVAIATVSLPRLSHMSAELRQGDFNASLTHSAVLCLLLTLPACTGLWIHADDFIRAIYRYRSFTEHDVLMTGAALKSYAVGLSAYAMVKVFVPAYYAVGRSRIPVLGTLVSIVTNIFLCNLWVEHRGHAGLALATSLAALANLVVLVWYGSGRIWSLEWRLLAVSGVKIAASCVVMAYCGTSLQAWWHQHHGHESAFWNLAGALVFTLAGGGIFFLLCGLFGVTEVSVIAKKCVQKIRGILR